VQWMWDLEGGARTQRGAARRREKKKEKWDGEQAPALPPLALFPSRGSLSPPSTQKQQHNSTHNAPSTRCP